MKANDMEMLLANTAAIQGGSSNLTSSLDDNFVALSIIGIIGFLIFIAIIGKMSMQKEREKTKREVAAYTAEGSITPEDAERILSSGKRN